MFENWLDFEDSPKGKCVKITGLHHSGLPFEFNGTIGIHTMTLLEAKAKNSKGEESSFTCSTAVGNGFNFIIGEILSLPVNGQNEEILFKNNEKFLKKIEPELKQNFQEETGIDIDNISEQERTNLIASLGKMSEFFFEDKSLGEGIVTDFSVLGDGQIWANLQDKPDFPTKTRNDAIKIGAITSISEVPQFSSVEESFYQEDNLEQ